jgi:hypothetical protein
MGDELEKRYSLVGQLLIDAYMLFALTDGEVFYDIATGRAYACGARSNTEGRVMLKNEVREACEKQN